jgi:hypothetical protein
MTSDATRTAQDMQKTPWSHNTNTGTLKTGHFEDHVKRERHGDMGITVHTQI